MKRNLMIGISLVVMFVGVIAGTVLYSQAGGGQPAAGAGGGETETKDRVNFILDDESKEAERVLGKDTAKTLYTVVVDTFEEAGEWYAAMATDQGFIVSRRMPGVPLALKKQGAQDVKTAPKDGQSPPKMRKEDGTYQTDYYVPYKDNRKYVLGVRVDYNRRGNSWFAIYPYRPIRLEGLVKSFEVWVSGRQKNHRLSIVVADVYGNDKLIPLGKLNFLGWKRLRVQVPDLIKQHDFAYSTKRGLVFKGFYVECEPLEAWGKYYIYFDNLTAEVSRFWEEYQDQRDPMDTW
ncbi:MAG: flagellar filament outer layer protein FlaA [Spirochaetota bacterium]|nr:flagellar filament outer layer protein FlaA [Spirochaetota bacterium]